MSTGNYAWKHALLFFLCVALLSHETTKFKECVQTVSCRQPLPQPRNQPCKKEQRTNWNFHFFLRFLFVQKPRNPRHVLRVHFSPHILWILKSHAAPHGAISRFWSLSCRGGHRRLQIGRILDSNQMGTNNYLSFHFFTVDASKQLQR